MECKLYVLNVYICTSVLIMVCFNLPTYVLADSADRDGLDRSKNEIKEFVTDLDNEITTAQNQRQTTNKINVPNKTTTQRPVNARTTQGHSGTTQHKVDSMDRYLLDGLLDIVDEKFSTLNKRLMTLERGINNLQYYNVRSFRVVNTHLHAVDTILHNMNSQIGQVENQNIAFQQTLGAIKSDVFDIQTTNTGVFQTVEQNLVHFHADMQARISEVKHGIEQSNFNIYQLRNETKEIGLDVEILKHGNENVKIDTEDLVQINKDILQTSSVILNMSMAIYDTAHAVEVNTLNTNKSVSEIARNVSYLARDTSDIREGLSLVMANITAADLHDSSRDESVDQDQSKYHEFKANGIYMKTTCKQMLELLDEKLKQINVPGIDKNTDSHISSKDCNVSPGLDQKSFDDQSRKLLRALSTVNENVYQSVTLYKHTGNLIERVISDTELIASEQVKLREELLAYLLNGTLELFNRSMPDISDLLEMSDGQRRDDVETNAGKVTGGHDGKCSLSKQIMEEMSQMTRNGSQLFELLTDLAMSSTATVKQSLSQIDAGVSILNKFQDETLNSYAVNKAEAFSRDTRNTQLRDIQNQTDKIYLFVEAIASNTGWIPFLYHRIMFVENQVNKTLGYISNIDTSVKELVPRQGDDATPSESKSAVQSLSDLIFGNADDTQTQEPSKTVVGNEYTDMASAFDTMMQFVYKTNKKINRLVPALTNLLGEPEPYIVLVDGATDKEGRVEIYNKGEWGTIPGPFSHVEASYVCRKLGYLGGISAGSGYFGVGSGTFWNLNVTCLRTRWCSAVSHVTEPTRLSHQLDVGVICEHMLRLTITNDEEEPEVARHSGRLEMYHHNSWLPVCYKDWGRHESSVVCMQLGYREGSASPVTDESLADSHWVTNIACTGSESRLDLCMHSEVQYKGCIENQYVFMTCS